MRNQFLNSSVWRTWRSSGAPMVQLRLQYKYIIRTCTYVTGSVVKSYKNLKSSYMWYPFCDNSSHNAAHCIEISTFKEKDQMDDKNTITWSKMGGRSTSTKTGIWLWPYRSQTSTSRNKCICLGYFRWITVLRHQAYMIWSLEINRDHLEEWGLIINFNDQMVTWG
jgi:hypothetical protein